MRLPLKELAPPAIGPTTALKLAGLLLVLAAYALFLGPYRRLAQSVGLKLGAWIPVQFSRILCSRFGVKVRLHGAIAVGAKQLVVANHVSWLDIPVLASVAPMSFLAKKEIGASPVGRALASLQSGIYVDSTERMHPTGK